jgi:hypothetical protein
MSGSGRVAVDEWQWVAVGVSGQKKKKKAAVSKKMAVSKNGSVKKCQWHKMAVAVHS